MTVTTTTLLAEAEALDTRSDDIRQEYMALRLEGHDETTARYRAFHVGQHRFDTSGGGPWIHGDQPDHGDLQSFTMDHRSDDERAQAWEESEILDRALRMLDDTTQALIIDRYGLYGHDPLQVADVALKHGLSLPTCERRLRAAVDTLRQECNS